MLPTRRELPRRAANAKRRDDEAAREKQTAARVQSIITTALDRPRSRETLPDLHDLVSKLESAYDLAMATSQPKSAVDCVLAMGRLTGILVDRSAVVHGTPADFKKSKEEVLADLRDEIGDAAMERVMKMYRAIYGDNGVIEGRRLSNGNGAGGGGDAP
jgi:hypothetical protein